MTSSGVGFERCPAKLVTYSPEQTFYFAAAGLQRRTDHHSWAHEDFGGIVVPALRRALALQPDGSVIAKPVLLDVETFDAAPSNSARI